MSNVIHMARYRANTFAAPPRQHVPLPGLLAVLDRQIFRLRAQLAHLNFRLRRLERARSTYSP